MGILVDSIRGASPENPSTNLANPAQWLIEWFGGGPSSSGVTVNDQTAMRSTTVFRCASLIVNTIATVPWFTMKRTSSAAEIAPDHPNYRKLHNEPNPMHSSTSFRQLLCLPMLFAGNGISVIVRKLGQVDQFLPIDSTSVEVARKKNRLRYTVQFEDGKEDLDQTEVIHIPGLGFDGIKGMSVISSVAKDPIGLSLGLEQYSAMLHKTSTVARGAVEIPGSLKGNKDVYANLKDGIRRMMNMEDPALILDAGMKWQSLQINPVDAQILEQRRFQIADICRAFGVPPFMVGEQEKSTSWGTGLEQQVLGFLKFTLRYWFVAIEQEFNRKVFKPPYFCEFNLDGLLRGDSKTQADVHKSDVNNGIRTPNEVRKLKNLPAMEGGDTLLVPGNLRPITEPYKGGTDVSSSAPVAE